MSDYHRPTATFKDGAYNATQVRLYGLDGLSQFPAAAANAPGQSRNKNKKVGEIAGNDAAIGIKNNNGHDVGPEAAEINALAIDIRGGLVGLYVITEPGTILWPAIIFGYAYEGHCYDLPKPKVMLLPEEPKPIPPDDCGYDQKAEAGYLVWIVDKLDQCVEIEVNRGFVEQLVLDANMPGRRSPSTYRATMAVSHRAGRSME